jgi:hypothetical protein
MPKLSLERLIQSLTQGELRAFSLSIKKEKNPSYYALFNDIRSGKHEESKKKDNNETQRRNYLYNSILESLVRSSKTIDSQISKGLHHVELLYNRQLEKEAWKELERAEKLAKKHERFGYILQILEWKKIIGFKLKSFSTDEYRAISEIEKKTIEEYLEYLKASDTYHELLLRKKKQGYIHEVEKLPDFTGVDLINPKEHIAKRTLYYQRMAHATQLCLLQDTHAQYELTKQIVKDAAVINEANECLQAYFEHLTSCICVGKFDELLQTLNKLRHDIKIGKFGSDQTIKVKLFYYASNYELMSYSYMGDRPNLILKIKEVENGIEKLGDSLSTEMRMVIYSALKMAYFFIDENSKTKSYLEKITALGPHKVRMDILQDSLFFYLLLATDENDVNKMDLILKRIELNCDLNKPHYKFDKELYSLFLKHSQDHYNKEELYNKLIASYNKITPSLLGGLKYTENNYIFYLWAVSNQAKESLFKTAQERYISNFKN